MIYTDIGNITVSMTRHVSQRFSFVKQINLDVSLKHNSDAHSQSGGRQGGELSILQAGRGILAKFHSMPDFLSLLLFFDS